MTSLATLVLASVSAALLSAAVRRLPGPSAVPLPDRWHRTVTPASGGIALFGAFLLALQPGLFSAAVDRDYLPLILGTGAAFALGLWDDAASIGVQKKFAGQLAIALAAACAGLRPDWLPLWDGRGDTT